jgi:medium-chain acyl-[acyl-carrier-protein] hydrolase
VTEPPFASLDPLIREATRGFAPYLDKPFAFFGHSMGALISFELARRLRAEGRRGPLKMFVSGCRAPQMPNRDPLTYNLPEPEFVKELKRLKGTPPEVFESQELMQLVLPVLRADFGICQTYAYQHEPPLACPIYAFGGLEDDEVGLCGVEAWREQTASSFSMHMFEGDHFFLRTAGPPLLRILGEELHRLTAAVT